MFFFFAATPLAFLIGFDFTDFLCAFSSSELSEEALAESSESSAALSLSESESGCTDFFATPLLFALLFTSTSDSDSSSESSESDGDAALTCLAAFLELLMFSDALAPLALAATLLLEPIVQVSYSICYAISPLTHKRE